MTDQAVTQPGGRRKAVPLIIIFALLWAAMVAVILLVWTQHSLAGLSVQGKFLAWLLTNTAALWAAVTIAAAVFDPKVGLIVLLVGYPVVNRPVEYFNYVAGVVEITPFNVCLIIIAILSLRRLRALVLTRADAWLIAFAAIAFIPTLMAADPVLAVRGYLFAIIEPIVVYFLLKIHFGPDRWRQLLAVFAGFLVVHWTFIAIEAVRAGGISELMRGRLEGGAFYGPGAPRVFTGGLAEPVQASWAILPLLPLFVFAAPYARRWQGFVAIGIVAEVLIGLSRLPFASLALLFPIAFIVAASLHLRRVWKLVIVFALAAIVLAVPLFPMLLSRFSSAKIAGVASDPMILNGREMDVNTLFYMSLIRAGATVATDHPGGIGLNNMNHYPLAYNWSEMLSNSNVPNVNALTLVPHLGAVVAFGWLGTILFVAFLISIVLAARRYWRSAPESGRAVAAGAAVSVIVFGLLLGKFFPIPIGGYLVDQSIDPVAAPSNQQAVWSFIVLAFTQIASRRDIR